MRIRNFLMLMCVIGVFGPWIAFVPFVIEHGLDLPLIVRQMFVSRVSAFVSLGAILSALTLVVYIISEIKWKPIRLAWVAIAGTLVLGPAFGLPFWLLVSRRLAPFDEAS
jgi:hypothetical protein